LVLAVVIQSQLPSVLFVTESAHMNGTIHIHA